MPWRVVVCWVLGTAAFHPPHPLTHTITITTTPPKPNQTNQAHYIKTRSTSTAKAVFALTSLNKWCLTGTPLQNRVGELYSLVRFLRMDPHAYYFCRCVLVLLCFVFVGWELGVLGSVCETVPC